MICFPLDNTPCEAKDMGTYLATRTRGVFSSDGNLAVTPGESGLSVSVSPGLAWLKWSDYWGTAALQEQALTLDLDTADGTLKRIDAIVCRLDKVNNLAEIVVKKGPFSSSPVLLPPVRDTNYDELYIATILIDAGIVNISADAITDQRLNEEYCGLMRDGVTGIPTALLQEQVQQLIDHLREEINGVEQGSEVMLKTIYDPQGRNTDIFAAIPNPNLLDNSDYKIAQAGYNGAHGNTAYLCDRWSKYLVDGSMTDDGMLLTPSGAGAWIIQYKLLTDTGLSKGDTVTLTVRADGTIYSGSATLQIKSAAVDADSMVDTDDIRAAAFIPAGNTDQIAVYIVIKQTCTLAWTKLEKGSVATPYVPKGYGAELAECLRYYQKLNISYRGEAFNVGDGEKYFTTISFYPMRTIPSVNIISQHYWGGFSGLSASVPQTDGVYNNRTLQLTLNATAQNSGGAVAGVIELSSDF